MNRIGKFIRLRLEKITASIAFYPAVIALCFLGIAFAMIEFDFSEVGKHLKTRLSWVSLKDASTARSIISTIAGAIISLTVFSFSMVMIVLNQAASQMSNRVLSSMIENRFQQIVLGFYIGTVVYALALLSTIRDINTGIYVPAMSIYLLILLTIVDIFLFIYFLDYVTRTVKYETVIFRVHANAMETMKKRFGTNFQDFLEQVTGELFPSQESGFFQGINKKVILEIAKKEDLIVSFLFPLSSYVVKGVPLVRITAAKKRPDAACVDRIMSSVDFYQGQPIERNADYGFRQLAEIGIRALSPGINDPATAVLTIQALTDLFAFRLSHFPVGIIADEEQSERILIPMVSFESLFLFCMKPIKGFGKDDLYITGALETMCSTLRQLDQTGRHNTLLNTFMGSQ